MTWLRATADRSADESAGVVLDVDVPSGALAFVNGGTDDDLWGRAYPREPGVDRIAVGHFVAVARASAAAAGGSRAVATIGEGLLARLVRAALPGIGEAEPEVVIDTTGSPARIRAAVGTLLRLGRLVLAAPPLAAEVELATYRDIHCRGLTILGVPWQQRAAHADDPRVVEQILAAATRTLPGRAAPRSPLYIVQPRRPG